MVGRESRAQLHVFDALLFRLRTMDRDKRQPHVERRSIAPRANIPLSAYIQLDLEPASLS